MADSIRTGLTPAEGRKFGITVGLAFLALAGFVWWRDNLTVARVLGAIGALLFVAGLVIPAQLGPVYNAWMKLALLISKVTTPIFMGIVFFLVITPTGLIMRLVGRRPLRAREVDNSYWVVRPDGERRTKSLERPF